MIHKTCVGSRIADARKNKGFTQADLAERMKVTPQAVSRWETGASLPDLDMLLQLSHLFEITINELLEGRDILRSIACMPYEMDEIARFVPAEERDYNQDFVRMIVEENLIPKCWDYQKERTANHAEETVIAKTITERGGVILLPGVGPGGSNLRAILQENPHARLIVNDLSPTVVKEWKRFLDGFTDYSEISYAAFDFCQIPFIDCSIDTISDYGGLVNTEGDIRAAIHEMYRVLKSGGLLITTGSFIKPSSFSHLSENEKGSLLEAFPSLAVSSYDEFIEAGFSHIETEVKGEYVPEAGDSTLGDYLKEHGLSITLTDGIRYCYKQ